MRKETKTFKVEYTMYDKGEKVNIHGEGDKVFTVSECYAPMCAGDEVIIFVEGRDYGLMGESVSPATTPVYKENYEKIKGLGRLVGGLDIP